MTDVSWLDRALLPIAPGWVARRAADRLRAEALLGHRSYDGAGNGRRNDGWRRPQTSANAETAVAWRRLAAGAREMVRNNGHAANAINVLTANIVGTGIRPSFHAESDEIERRLREAWEKHIEADSSGAGETPGVYQRQALAVRCIVESGSVLLRRRRRDSNPLGYAVQVMEPDYLATDRDGVLRNGRIVHGKEYDNNEELRQFHLYTNHPGETWASFGSLGKVYKVPPRYVSHAYRMDRPGQGIGVSWFAPVMSTLRDLADTRDAYQLRQKIAACFTAFIYESEPGTGTTHRGQPINDHIEPGRVESLPPGKDVKFAAPPGVDGMSDFDRAQLMTIAAGLGIPYEALTGDLSRVSFLSGRMGWLAFYRNIDIWRTGMVIPRIVQREVDWFLEVEGTRLGADKDGVKTTFTSPHRDLLDPKQEIAALREEMRLGALSYPDLVRMRGRNPDIVLNEWEKWAKDIESRELAFDWMPSKFSMAGNDIQDKEAGDAGSTTET